jgi:hypothetical protein
MSGLPFRRALGVLTVMSVTLAMSASASATEAPSLDAYAGEAAVLGSSHNSRGPGRGASHKSSGSSAQRSGLSANANIERSQTTSAGHPTPTSSTGTSRTPSSRSGSISTRPHPEGYAPTENTASGTPLLSPLDILLLVITCAGLLCASLLIRRLAHRPR